MYAWHHDGTPVTGWPRLIPTRDAPFPNWDRRCSPALADLDGDGDLEVGLGLETRVFFWDTAGLAGRAPWPTFQADVARTGALICPTPTIQAVQVFTDGLTATFSAGVEATPPISYLWEFGDGSTLPVLSKAEGLTTGGITSTLPTVTHTYPVYGVYPFTLTVEDVCGTDAWCSHVHLPSPWWRFYLPVVVRNR